MRSVRRETAASPTTPRQGALLLLAQDPLIVAAADAAARALGHAPPQRVACGAEALAVLLRPAAVTPRLICEPTAAGPHWAALLATAGDPFTPSGLVVVGASPTLLPPGLARTKAAAGPIAARLADPPRPPQAIAAVDAAALARGVAQGEIVVRYQPIVRLSDRRPVMFEALARWLRHPAPLPPDAFMPLAERAGLGPALARAVASLALADLAALPTALRPRLSLNLPLPVLQAPETLPWLRAALARAGLAPAALVIELTETSPVHDTALLGRAIWRLRQAGIGVLLDDLGLDDPRRRLLALPFTGVKLDRHFVAALPQHRRARAEAERIAAQAARQGMTVTAEGVASPLLWRALEAVGVDAAQGFAVARPLPAAALPAWARAWRQAGRAAESRFALA